MRSTRMSAMLMAAALAAATPFVEGSPRAQVTANVQQKKPDLRNLFGAPLEQPMYTGRSPNGGHAGKHKTNRQHQRAAAKARNVRRHRAH